MKQLKRERPINRSSAEVLSHPEAILESIIANSPYAMWISDSKGTLIRLNQACRDLLHIKDAEVVGKYNVLQDNIVAQQGFMPLVKEVFEKGKTVNFTLTYDSSQLKHLALENKAKVILDVTISAVKDFEGNITNAIIQHIDVTARKQAEQSLRMSEGRFRMIVETSPDYIIQTDKLGNILYASPACKRIVGYDPAELINHNYSDFIPPSSLSTAQFLLAEALTGVMVHNVETEVLHKNGRAIAVEASIASQMVNGEVISLYSVIRDITARKQAEEERSELDRKAQNVSRLASIGEMAAGIAHEILNPLTPILGLADLLLSKRDLPADIRADLQIIHDSARQAADTTRRLLTFARQIKPMRTACSINEVIETALRLRAYHLKTNNIKVVTELAPELPQTMVDAGQLQQVMLNLIMNAEYAMTQAPEGGNLLLKTEQKNNIIRILVKDDGPGISKDNMEKLFHPFFTTKTVGEGTGLGLSVCHGIVAEHHGRIYAESEVGKGATFIVEIPIVPPQKEEEAKLSESDIAEAGKAVKARILVVDDEPTIVQVLKRVLTVEGYEVESTDKAKEALGLIKGGNYAIIMLDVKLPDMSGIELYRYLEKTDKPSAQRIMFLTGDDRGPDTMDFFSRTGAAYITQPFDIEQLKKEVKSKLHQSE